MKVLTIASRRTLPLRLLEHRAVSAFEFVVLGRDSQWTSFQPKLACLYDFSQAEIEAGRGDELFVFVDAFDVIVVNRDPCYYRSLYRGRPLFAAEMFNWPDKHLQYPAENVRHRQPYLNSGCFIATPRDMFRLLTDNDFQHATNDQLYWARVYVGNSDLIDLDFDSRLCACLIACLKDSRALQHHGRDLVFLQQFKNPAVLHFNGPARIKKLMWRWYACVALQTFTEHVRQRLKRSAIGA